MLRRLFPLQSAERLAHLSRQELLSLAQGSPLTSDVTPGPSTAAQNSDAGDDEREWNEPQEIRVPGRAVCDDVNGLSLSVHRRSYMGTSSVHAVFRAMFRVRPSLQMELKNQLMVFQEGTRAAPSLSETKLRDATPAVDDETSIDAYFAHVHGIVPILNEAEFRSIWRRQERRDRPWCALLNMVLVLGSLSIGDSDDSSQIYYARAKVYFDLELLGTGCVDTLRALCLLGGLYLHYKNAPNMAYAIMGMAYRIAISLGLHRHDAHFHAAQNGHTGAERSRMRRQIWWSLFCLDTWGSMTLGRPTLGRWDPETMDVPSVSSLEKPDPLARALDCARSFCVIATRVQHRFAQRVPTTTGEIVGFDSEVKEWYGSLPHELTQLDVCPERLISAQYIMRNRYFNLRLLLYRSVLLRYANAEIALGSLPVEERHAIQCCRKVAAEAIDCVVSPNYSVDRIRAWSAVWYLYQASMALLLNILVDTAHSESAQWRTSIEKALLFFEHAKPWSSAADRSSQVVRGLLDLITNSSVDGVDMTSNGCTFPSVITSEAGMEYDSWNFAWGQLGLGISTEQDWDWDAFNDHMEPQADVDWYGNL